MNSRKICLDFWDALLGNKSADDTERLKNATKTIAENATKTIEPAKVKAKTSYYRVYPKERLYDVLANGVIPKMSRRGITLLEDDAVFMAASIKDAMILSPIAREMRLESDFYNSVLMKRYAELFCRYWPEKFTLVERDTTMYALKIKAEWLDTALLFERDNLGRKEYLYPNEIIIPETPAVFPVNSIPGYYGLMIREEE